LNRICLIVPKFFPYFPRGLFNRLPATRRIASSIGIALGFASASMGFASTPPASSDAAAAQEDVASDASELSAAVLWGIISYTRWPQEDAPLKICLIGESAHAEAIRRLAMAIEFRRTVVVHDLPAETEKAQECDVAYFGSLPEQQRNQILHSLTGLPVLTIGEGGVAFCSAGGMFCLHATDAASSNGGGLFATNLDVISRSGLRITPRVLRLSRHLRSQEN
jgi:hypothetical protein